MSLVGIRDLSLLQTPPADRQPILTFVGEYDERVAVEAIRRELLREGQVFWVHNRVKSIEGAAARLRELVPEARIAVAHGQMDEGSLEQVVVDFWEGHYDVLVCTTIIESGIDMPTVNTLVVERSDLLGLGQMHQLRGRVGRSGQRAYAYLFHPRDRTLSEEAYERLRTIGESTDLGSGFRIAMRDLEIRGAGDLLGGEQSGFISDMGFDMYQKILSEAVRELKEQEFKKLYEQEPTQTLIEETQIDTDLELLIPDEYVNQIEERLRLYQKLNGLKTEDELQAFASELKDRFGALPQTVLELLNSLRLRWKGRNLGFEKLVLKQSKFIAYFIADGDHPYFRSDEFQSLLMGLKAVPNAQMKERNGKLSLVFPEVDSIEQASELLSRLLPSTANP